VNRFVIRSPFVDELASVRALMVRVIELDYGYPYQSRFHDDVDDPFGFYLKQPRHTLLVAVDDGACGIVGVAGVRVLRIAAPPHPRSIVARYDPHRSAELTRVFVAPEHRRRGVGRELVVAARHWVRQTGDFDVVCFHSRTAVDFWRSFSDVFEVLDARDGSGLASGGQVYFEFPVR
jgi:GNAT superfamily N-acetyltransferase